jgi:hypothetical protein
MNRLLWSASDQVSVRILVDDGTLALHPLMLVGGCVDGAEMPHRYGVVFTLGSLALWTSGTSHDDRSCALSDWASRLALEG